MPITFAVRGNSFTPRRNLDRANHALHYQTSQPTITVDAGALSGSVHNYEVLGTLGQQGSIYDSGDNIPSTPAISVLLRFKISSVFDIGLWSFGGLLRQGTRGWESLYLTVDATNFVVSGADENAGTIFNIVSFAHGGLSTGTFYDVVLTWTGTTSTNGLELFLDGSSLGTSTAVRPFANPKRKIHRAIGLGVGNAYINTYFRMDEFVIWDTVINPTSVALESGTGSLNGASRTSLVDAEIFDGGAVSGGGDSPVLEL